MYTDHKPCAVCGSPVELQARTGGGDRVAEADPTVDERICTNPDCPTNNGEDVNAV
ncbi:hypothetical protein [Nocardioides aquiterrae]|uniref:Uncharacterized protein n=1 Tax=Nocardioides aquiterrae TaxID=203799 RepID=A0ABP4FB84_9ACTN